jgi:hypothetical protein
MAHLAVEGGTGSDVVGAVQGVIPVCRIFKGAAAGHLDIHVDCTGGAVGR